MQRPLSEENKVRESGMSECPRTLREIAEDFLAGRSCDVGELQWLRRTERQVAFHLSDEAYTRLCRLVGATYRGVLQQR